MVLFAFVLLSLHFLSSFSIDNGIGLTPPMGWRSWNQFQCDGFPAQGKEFNQELVMRTIDSLVDKSRKVDGVPTSLRDVGYIRAGLDDCWQQCDSGPGGKGWHDATGNPIVNKTRFPDLKAMTDYAHKNGIKSGWYMNNCHCSSSCSSMDCFEGDSKAVAIYGFDSVKIDGCSAEKNISLWAELINKTGRPIMIENCGNGPSPDPSKTPKEQPYNFFRSSTDIRPTYGSVLSNLQSVKPWINSVGPGCWAYPDMLEVGVTNGQGTVPTLTVVESRTHFGAWCVVSSPLTLGLDLTDSKAVDSIWDIVTNKEAIAVNQAWVGHPGNLIEESTQMVSYSHCSWSNNDCKLASWQVWAKPTKIQSGKINQEVAVLLINNDVITQDVAVNFSVLSLGCTTCHVRDIWAHKDAGNFTDNFIAHNLAPHDSTFVLIYV